MQALAGSNPDEDVAVDTKTAQGLNLPEIHLEAIKVQEIPLKKGTPAEHIKRVILYRNPHEITGPGTLYLALQMFYRGSEEDAVHIVGIFNGYPDIERTELLLNDMDGDGVPEVALCYQAGTDISIVRTFRFAEKEHIADDTSNIPIGAVLKQTGYFGNATLAENGTVIVRGYADERGAIPLPVEKYRLIDGVMKKVEK